MLKVVTAKEMQEIDRLTIEDYGIAGTVLMERAGLAVVRRINELFPRGVDGSIQDQERRIIVLCGGGNNGGDGLVVARMLHNQGMDVRTFLTADPEDLKGDARINYNAAIRFGVKVYPMSRFLSHHASRITHHDIIVDALLGTGLNKDVREPLRSVIERVNKSSSVVISIDIPSGISSDNGQVMGTAIKADYTVTFGLPKRGHLLYPGAEYTGRLFVEDIGFPSGLLMSKRIMANLVEQDDVVRLIPERPRYSHKGTYGHVLLVAGSKGKTGAGIMAARASLRTGAGLVTIGVPEGVINVFQSKVTEEMTLPLPDKGNGTLSRKAVEPILGFLKKRANVLAIGPGISVDDEIRELVRTLILNVDVPVVIDADGLNAIADGAGTLRKARAPLILTPHPGEMVRLVRGTIKHGHQDTELTTRDIERERIDIAVSFARKTSTYVVLKGVPTVTATPDGEAFLNPTGNPGMAKAGTGDVLTGIIAGLIAQGLSPVDASIAGVYIHGLAGDISSERKGVYSMVASDIIRAIPQAFRRLGR
jgi:NAD(P)H-hydrate epimerase